MNRKQLAAFAYWPQLITFVLVGIAFLGYRYFTYYDTRSSDGYVSANVINITSLVSGPIHTIYIKENQCVKKGDPLVEIDPTLYDYSLKKAQAALEIAQNQYKNAMLSVTFAEEQLKQNQQALASIKQHFNQLNNQSTSESATQVDLLQLETKLKNQENLVLNSLHQLKNAQQNVDVNAIKEAQAELDTASYMLKNTLIRAPATGYVTNFTSREGQYVKEGTLLFALVETSQWWVTTRYKETMLRLIKPGDKATIKLDMYPGETFHGHVDSIGWGINRVQTGNVTSSGLMYLEATEDWIKIAQRFPVRIIIDDVNPKFPLRIGASATTVTSH